jgi:hypothetical protein
MTGDDELQSRHAAEAAPFILYAARIVQSSEGAFMRPTRPPP